MATYKLQHFCNRHTLRSIALDRLLDFLGPYRAYFEERNFRIPNLDNAGELNFDKLVEIFMTPDARTPATLIDALFLVDEMATDPGMESLLEYAGELHEELDGEPTPADVAVLVWLRRPEVLERKHAEQFLVRPKAFEYFAYSGNLKIPSETELYKLAEAAARELDDWFDQRKRGRGVKVFVFDRDEDLWFLIRHGEAFRREESLARGDVAGVSYRPLKYDVAVFEKLERELRINAKLVGQKRKYCEVIGRHFFGDDSCFGHPPQKYTLEPLRKLGEDCLTCIDVEDLEWIRLGEVELVWSGEPRLTEILKAADVFRALEFRERQLAEQPAIARAVFRVKFAEAKKARSVTIRVPNRAIYSRESDAPAIARWLTLRGFIVGEEPHVQEQPAETLVSM